MGHFTDSDSMRATAQIQIQSGSWHRFRSYSGQSTRSDSTLVMAQIRIRVGHSTDSVSTLAKHRFRFYEINGVDSDYSKRTTAQIQFSATTQIHIFRGHQHRFHVGNSTYSDFKAATAQMQNPRWPQHRFKLHMGHKTASYPTWATAQIKIPREPQHNFKFQMGHSTNSG
jgi:hypothetical protein